MSAATIQRETTPAPAEATYAEQLAEVRRLGAALTAAREELAALGDDRRTAEGRVRAAAARLAVTAETSARKILHRERGDAQEQAQIVPILQDRAHAQLHETALAFLEAVRAVKSAGTEQANAHYQVALAARDAAQRHLDAANVWTGHWAGINTSATHRLEQAGPTRPAEFMPHMGEIISLIERLEEAEASRPLPVEG